MAEIGHNSDPSNRREYVRRFKTLLEDARETAEEIRDLAKEAKGKGLNPKILRELAKQQMDAGRRAKFREFVEEFDSYENALGILD